MTVVDVRVCINYRTVMRSTIYTISGDSMERHHKGMKFTTLDVDNDAHPQVNCAVSYKGGWWYKHCYQVNLNGIYSKFKRTKKEDGVIWYKWKGHQCLKFTDMKIRPYNF